MNGPSPIGEGTHYQDMKVMDLQDQIGRGEYQVDAYAVADAIVRRILADRAQRSVQSPPSA
jgi:anti-sigma28 factor (negative regulator of flagellin synthesis)